MIDGVKYTAAPVPPGMEPANRYIAWAETKILGTSENLPGAQALCERAATMRLRHKGHDRGEAAGPRRPQPPAANWLAAIGRFTSG